MDLDLIDVTEALMPRLIMMQGISGSGKSTEAEVIKMTTPGDWRIVSRDEIRLQMMGKEAFERYCQTGLDQNIEQVVTQKEHLEIVKHLMAGKNVIVDNTNLKKKYIVEYLKLAMDCGLTEDEVMINYLDEVSAEEAYERVQKRGAKQIPLEVIQAQHEVMHSITWTIQDCWRTLENQGYCPRKWYVPPFEVIPAKENDNPDSVICDIDGTLAHRALLTDPLPRFRGFYDYWLCNTDKPDFFVGIILQGLSELGVRILFVSGRKEECRKETLNFIHEVLGTGFEFELFMRDPKIDRNDLNKDASDDIVKYRIFNDFIRDKYNVIGVIDDRKRVLALWEALELRVLNAGLLNEEF